MLEAASFALNKERGRAKEKGLEELTHPQRALARAHPRIHDFLVAKKLITDLLQYEDHDAIPDSLNCVFPERINRIAKEIMCSGDREDACMDSALRLLRREGCSFRAKVFVTYLIGRAKKEQLRGAARDILASFVDEARYIHSDAADTAQDREALLFARTVYITSAYLGNNAIKQEYVKLLMDNERLDGINRGFHLEYFGDQKYDAALPLQNLDRLEECPLTVERLYSRLISKSISPLLEIELQTFCSLGVKRHAQGSLTKDFQAKLTAVLKAEHVREAVKFAELKDYLLTVELCIGEEDLCAIGVLAKFSRESDWPRTGWVERGVQPCESVADHVLGAVRMAQFCLRAKSSLPRYCKDKIVSMILNHDCGESITGDIPPGQKGADEEEMEMRVVRQLGNVGVVPGLVNQREIVELYQEFQARESINAQIAQEIDKLQMLLKLYVYQDDGRLRGDQSQTTKKLGDAIRTPPGVSILNQINLWRRRVEARRRLGSHTVTS
jgi:5'-deoxynucleotidase YfbR-like HD superfamily hydrolase